MYINVSKDTYVHRHTCTRIKYTYTCVYIHAHMSTHTSINTHAHIDKEIHTQRIWEKKIPQY